MVLKYQPGKEDKLEFSKDSLRKLKLEQKKRSTFDKPAAATRSLKKKARKPKARKPKTPSTN